MTFNLTSIHINQAGKNGRVRLQPHHKKAGRRPSALPKARAKAQPQRLNCLLSHPATCHLTAHYPRSFPLAINPAFTLANDTPFSRPRDFDSSTS